MAKNKNRNPDSPESEVEEEETLDDAVEEEESSSSESQQTRSVELDRTWTYGGRSYGPGKVELPVAIADSIENRAKVVRQQEDRQREEGLAALGGSTQTQVNNTVAPMEYFQEEEKLSRANQKESKG